MRSTPPSLRVALAATAAVALLIAPAAARADPPRADAEGQDCDPQRDAPRGYQCASRRAYVGLLASGISLVGAGDTINFLTVALNHSADPIAAIPVAGPFIAAATHKFPAPPAEGGLNFNFNFDFSVFGYLAAGTLQAAGVVLLLSSIAVRKPRLKRETAAITFVPVPMVTPTGSGMGIVGTF